MNRRLFALVFCLVALGLPALTVEEGRLRLTLHESSGRFTIYYNTGEQWLPLLLDRDPRVSALEVREDNRVHRMGEAAGFRQEASRVEGGARFTWTSPTLEVQQTFRLTRGVESRFTDAVAISVTVTNLGEQRVTVGVRFLLDTYLGERDGVHFVTAADTLVTRERRFEYGDQTRYVASVPTPGSAVGFQAMLGGGAVTPVEKAVVANWRRLADSAWDYEVNPARNFSRLPFSVNDSALLLVYPAVELARREAATVVLHAGNLSPLGYVDPATVAFVPGGRQQTLTRLAEIVEAIDALIAGGRPSVEEVERLRQELAAIADVVRGP